MISSYHQNSVVDTEVENSQALTLSAGKGAHVEEFVTSAGLHDSCIDHLHLMLAMTFKHMISQAKYSLSMHFEYLIPYILKQIETQHPYHKVHASI